MPPVASKRSRYAGPYTAIALKGMSAAAGFVTVLLRRVCVSRQGPLHVVILHTSLTRQLDVQELFP